MGKSLIRAGQVVTMDGKHRVLSGASILVDGTRIGTVVERGDAPPTGDIDEVVDVPHLVAIPGFVQTHIHLCQTLFRGLADDLDLLDWLRLRIFPYEAAHDSRSMHASAMLGIAELIRSGTTTIMDMGSLRHQEEIFRALTSTGLRAFAGKSMIDLNDIHPPFREPTDDALASTREQANRWHGSSGGRIRYAVAPRFVLSCSEELLRAAHAMLADFPGMLFHTHAAESRRELEAVRARCGMQNVEYFDSINVLGRRTCLAHCIWLNDREVSLLGDTGTRVLHCPSSNLKLGSGVAGVPGLLRRGISVSLGADGAPCNNSLNMFTEMRLAALLQKPVYGPTAMTAETVLAMATIGGAEALGIGGETGSLESGKAADIVLFDPGGVWMPALAARDIYSTIVYSGAAENVDSVMIDGAWVYRSRNHVTLDAAGVASTARQELERLLLRT